MRELPLKKKKKQPSLASFDLDLDDIIGATVENEITFVITTYTLSKDSCCCVREKPKKREVKVRLNLHSAVFLLH